ncbi:hypothetical protein T01_6190 [Trichinella spiralis]|uniref:Uncharacterized protein n=1 Tax=Trichinella spiralis TaxID=6334 RepID=A0A0V1BGT0_TRISP|nr:hypothetical protein T01_6190 [Trichinella spiralis]
MGNYKLFTAEIADQGVMDCLIQQMLSENAAIGDLRLINSVYDEKQSESKGKHDKKQATNKTTVRSPMT